MIRRATVGVALAAAGCFGDPPPTGDGDATESSGTPSTSAAPTSEPSTSASSLDSSDSAVMTTGAPTTDDVTSVQPASSGDSGIVHEPFCTGIAADVTLLACEDFDGAGGVVGTWTPFQEQGATAEVLADNAAPSPPNAFRTSFGEQSGRAPYAETRTDLGVLVAPMSVRFRMETMACTAPTPLVNVAFGGPDPVEVRLVYTGVELALVIHGADGVVTPYTLDPVVLGNAGSWAEYGLDIDVADRYVDVHVGGEVAAHVTDIVVPMIPLEPPALHFGVLGGGFDSTCTVLFDDIYAY